MAQRDENYSSTQRVGCGKSFCYNKIFKSRAKENISIFEAPNPEADAQGRAVERPNSSNKPFAIALQGAGSEPFFVSGLWFNEQGQLRIKVFMGRF